MAQRVVELMREALRRARGTGNFWHLVDRLFDREDRDPVCWRIREVVTIVVGSI